MAIKVIKHGEKTFKIICPICGCEFEYEYEDLVDSYLPGLKQIKCPDCGEWLTHKKAEPVKDITWNFPKPGEPIPCNIENPCKDCDFHKRLESGQPYIGDSPCDWCKKNPWKPTWSGDKFTYITSIDKSENNDYTLKYYK